MAPAADDPHDDPHGDAGHVAPPDFDSYIATSWDTLWRFAYLVTGHAADAEDVVQDVLAKVWPQWVKICAQGNPGAYLRRCIVNAKVSVWRKTRRQTPYADLPDSLSPANDHSQAVADALALAQVLRQLPRRQRAVVTLRYLEDRSYADIAGICDTTQAAARSLVHRSLAQLRRELTKEES